MAASINTTDVRKTARRSFLAALVAAPVVVATAAPALAAAQSSLAIESPELLALGDQLSSQSEFLRESVARKEEALATFERTRPALPSELVALPRDRNYLLAEEREIRGGENKLIYVSKGVRAEIILRDISRHTKEGRRLRRIARIAKAYEDAEMKALEASDRDPLSGEATSRGAAYFKLVQELVKHTPTTMRGMQIFARAISLMPVAAATLGYTSATPQERQLAGKLVASLIQSGATYV